MDNRYAHHSYRSHDPHPMDEQEYKKVYRSVNEQRCAFEKAVLTRMFGCEKVVKINIAEREAVGCTDPLSQQQCLKLLELMRSNATFALKLTHAPGPLPHAKELKVQCGGLAGLQHAVEGTVEGGYAVANIHGLIEKAKARFENLQDLPHQVIVKSITAFAGRRKTRRNR